MLTLEEAVEGFVETALSLQLFFKYKNISKSKVYK